MRTGVANIIDSTIVSFIEKPVEPKYNWAIPPYYIYPRSVLPLIGEAIEQGCCADSLGYMIERLYKKEEIKTVVLKGRRYNCGDLIDYKYANNSYNGIFY